MNKVAIVDYGMCNLDSVARAVEECGGSPVVTSDRKDLKEANRIILPGVGSFADGMAHLRARGLEEILREQVLDQKIPFLGICLGMQFLAEKGFEGGETPGLGWIEGEVKRLEPKNASERIPHIGWNEVSYAEGCPLFKGIPQNKDFYFVHSYHLACKRPEQIAGRTEFCGGFVSAVARDNIFGVQFHPEKSQKPGQQILQNFLAI